MHPGLQTQMKYYVITLRLITCIKVVILYQMPSRNHGKCTVDESFFKTNLLHLRGRLLK